MTFDNYESSYVFSASVSQTSPGNCQTSPGMSTSSTAKQSSPGEALFLTSDKTLLCTIKPSISILDLDGRNEIICVQASIGFFCISKK